MGDVLSTQPLTREEKRERYRARSYYCSVSPFTTFGWYEADWIAWIDKYGTWEPRPLSISAVGNLWGHMD